jgi:hypothetical protein
MSSFNEMMEQELKNWLSRGYGAMVFNQKKKKGMNVCVKANTPV